MTSDAWMRTQLAFLDAVALMRNLPDRGLSRRQVKTIVESLAPGGFEAGFSDEKGVRRRGDRMAATGFRESSLAV